MNHGPDEELTISFFFIFSRYEYALKAAGKVGNNDPAEPDWGHVEKAIRTMDASQRERVERSAGILIQDPPRRQVYRDGQLQFVPAGPAGDHATNLVVSLKRVRNNLFHGGKYVPDGVALSARSRELVQCAVAVLTELLQIPALGEVAVHFHGYDPQEG